MAKKPAALSNPTHRVVAPDGTELFLVRHTRNTIRTRLLFDTPHFKAGYVDQAYGPAKADDFMMGRWIGPLHFCFGPDVFDLIPDGTYCERIAPLPSDSVYRSEVTYTRPDARKVKTGINRAMGTINARWPVTADEIETTRQALINHIVALAKGTFRPGELSPELHYEFLQDAQAATNYMEILPAHWKIKAAA